MLGLILGRIAETLSEKLAAGNSVISFGVECADWRVALGKAMLASAADLKFLSLWPRVRLGTSNPNAALKS